MQIEEPRSGAGADGGSDLNHDRQDHRPAAVGVGDPLAEGAADELLQLVGLDDRSSIVGGYLRNGCPGTDRGRRSRRTTRRTLRTGSGRVNSLSVGSSQA